MGIGMTPVRAGCWMMQVGVCETPRRCLLCDSGRDAGRVRGLLFSAPEWPFVLSTRKADRVAAREVAAEAAKLNEGARMLARQTAEPARR